MDLLDGVGEAAALAAPRGSHGCVSAGHLACRAGMMMCVLSFGASFSFALCEERVLSCESGDTGISLGILEKL